MGKYHNSVVVFQIGPKFWWMTALGVKYHHIKFEWLLVTGFAIGGSKFQILSKMVTKCTPCGNLGA